jgi:hypothetical protein
LQGVPVYGRGPTNIIRLKPPTAEDVRTLVTNRMRDVFAGSALTKGLPEVFPFDERSLNDGVINGQPLRATLIRLRDAYSARVYEQPVAPAKPPALAWDSLLETHWRDQLQAAARKLENGLAGQLQNVHAGLGALVKPLLPLSMDTWQLTEVQPTLSVGDNPTYGLVSLFTWSPPTDGNGSAMKVGVGFLLGKGGGMPRDLRAKLEFSAGPAREIGSSCSGQPPTTT